MYFFITLINGGDFNKCGGDIDGVNFAVERFDLHSPQLQQMGNPLSFLSYT